MQYFLLALQFLTIIPLKIKHIQEKKFANALIFFPVVGLCLGALFLGITRAAYLLNRGYNALDAVFVVALIVLTGGLHLDGLADTADALLSRKSREEMLNIMRDSRIGAMGALSIISVLLLKIAFLSCFGAYLKPLALMSACLLSRWAMVFAIFLFPYARSEGKAKLFIEGINPKIFAIATLIALAGVIFIWRINGIWLMGIAAAAAYLIGDFVKTKLGGITGDVLGALNEIIEVVVLCSLLILQKNL